MNLADSVIFSKGIAIISLNYFGHDSLVLWKQDSVTALNWMKNLS